MKIIDLFAWGFKLYRKGKSHKYNSKHNAIKAKAC